MTPRKPMLPTPARLAADAWIWGKDRTLAQEMAEPDRQEDELMVCVDYKNGLLVIGRLPG